jgi:hypothetical protein
MQKIIKDTLEAVLKPKTAAGPALDTSSLHKLFENACNHLKYPKINLKTKSGQNVRFSVSKKIHDIIYMNAGGFGTPFLGKVINTKGVELSIAGRRFGHEIEELVKEFAADPAGISAAQGKLHHSCVYCSKGLTTPESLAVGYGPECAKHYGLPWGKNVAPVKPTREQLVA